MRLEDRFNDREVLRDLVSNPIISQDLFMMICGKKIGEGQTRMVYEYNLDKRFVVKIETGNSGDNYNEYQMWHEIEYLKGDLKWVKDWFAPVHYISPCGRILIMERTKVKKRRERPKKIPKFIKDSHYNNFGWLGKKFVCHDYGFIYGFIEYKKKFVKPVYVF